MNEEHWFDVIEVSQEAYDRVVALLERARELQVKAKRPSLTLAQKLELQRQAKEARAAALAVR